MQNTYQDLITDIQSKNPEIGGKLEGGKKFKIKSDFSPAGDQPEAIKKLVQGAKKDEFNQVLLGVTGSGKTFTMAKIIEELKKMHIFAHPSAWPETSCISAIEAMAAGWVGSIAGFDCYWSDQIDEDVSSGGDAAGFAFSKGAVGLAVGPEGLFRIETERNASFRTTEYVATGFWSEVETKDAYGVYILTDVS